MESKIETDRRCKHFQPHPFLSTKSIVVKSEKTKNTLCDLMKKRVLFICTHNSARSQVAEAFLNSHYGDRYEAQSAGIEPTEVNPYAIKVMAEIGIDIT